MSAHVIIPASEDPNDLTVAEWQDLNFALGNVSASIHAAVMTIARRIRVAALAERDAEVEARVREEIAQAIEECCKARVENNDQRLNFSKGATAAYTQAARIARGGAR